MSHAGRDLAWAEWVAWQLEQAGHQVELDAWDWAAGDNFVVHMSTAIEQADAVVALYSQAYFEPERFTTDEWAAVLARRQRLVPLRIEEVRPAAVLAPVAWRDLFGREEAHARHVLLKAVAGASGRPASPPPFPGGSDNGPSRVREQGPRLPGRLPPVWNMPARSGVFTGRDGLLVALREGLRGGDAVVVQAVHGMGGVGKTTLALEYAHRLAGTYDLAWWIDAERADLIGTQLAALGAAAGWVDPGAAAGEAVRVVHRQLAGTPDWLLVFDNAEDPAHLDPWLPQGSGHVLITSRNPAWTGVAEPLGVDVFTRAESVALLETVAPGMSTSDADRLAQAVGDLPLALAQAAAVITETGMTATDYLAELARHPVRAMSDGIPVRYRRSLPAAVGIAVDRLDAADPTAAELLRVCAFLAPEPVPSELFTDAARDALPPALAELAGSTFAVRSAMGRVARFGLGRVGRSGLLIHRLTQAVIRDTLDAASRTQKAALAQRLVISARPKDPDNPGAWPRWQRWLPHLLHLKPASSSDNDLLTAADFAVWYLILRGQPRASADLAAPLHERARDQFDPDHTVVLAAAYTLAAACGGIHQHQQAYDLDHDVLDRRRRILGEDHPDTLNSANSLAIRLTALGRHQEAHDLDQDTLTRRRRILGDDHPNTLTSAHSLAVDLSALGRHQEAHDIDNDTFNRRRRILGDDHPDTLHSAHSLAVDLAALGRHQEAHDLNQDTLTRRRRILGEEHPYTLKSAYNLAINLTHLGKHQEAQDLLQDALVRSRRVLGDNHPDTVKLARLLVEVLRTLGRDGEADEFEARFRDDVQA